MRILIIEDDPVKLNSIKHFLSDISTSILIEDRMSYQSGLFTLLRNSFDLVLLDMQLPNYDIKSGEDGYKLRPVAGRDILREIKRKKIHVKVIIVTQYEGFGENGHFASLADWDKKLNDEFGDIYIKTIQYKPGSNLWKDSLKQYLNF